VLSNGRDRTRAQDRALAAPWRWRAEPETAVTAAGEQPRPDLFCYRPDLDPANGAVRSWVYLLCLDPAIEHLEVGPHAGAAHYCGVAPNGLLARLARQGTSGGARLLQVQRDRGGSWHLVRTWPGGRWEERAIKEWKQGPKLCPEHSPGTRRGTLADVARAAARLRAGHAARYAGPGPELDAAQVLVACAARGREDAARFLAIWRDATADQIERAAAALQTPYYEGDRTPEGDAENGAFAEVVLARLARLREGEAARPMLVVQAAARRRRTARLAANDLVDARQGVPA
jgi:hypothetical protein